MEALIRLYQSVLALDCLRHVQGRRQGHGPPRGPSRREDQGGRVSGGPEPSRASSWASINVSERKARASGLIPGLGFAGWAGRRGRRPCGAPRGPAGVAALAIEEIDGGPPGPVKAAPGRDRPRARRLRREPHHEGSLSSTSFRLGTRPFVDMGRARDTPRSGRKRHAASRSSTRRRVCDAQPRRVPSSPARGEATIARSLSLPCPIGASQGQHQDRSGPAIEEVLLLGLARRGSSSARFAPDVYPAILAALASLSARRSGS